MELSGFQILWIAMAAIVFVGWLIASFSEATPGRAIIEWIAADAMYVGLLGLFVFLCLRAQDSGNTVALIAFGFLAVLFGGGLLTAIWHTFGAMSGASKGDHTATN